MATKKDGHRQRLTQPFSFGVVKAPALLNLPMQACRLLVVYLHPIDAEVVLFSFGVLCIDQRQGDKQPAVFLPGS